MLESNNKNLNSRTTAQNAKHAQKICNMENILKQKDLSINVKINTRCIQ
jgi:hypothetical protein